MPDQHVATSVSHTVAPLSEIDPELAAILEGELSRQRGTLEMIASENFAPRAVLEAQGSVLTNKYAEGLPGKRYYGGCEFVDVAENLARERLQRSLHVVDNDGGHRSSSRTEHGNRACCDRRFGEVMAVHLLADKGSKDATGFDDSVVDHHGGRHQLRRVSQVQSTSGEVGNLAQGEPQSTHRRCPIRSIKTARSSKGCTTPAIS